MLLGNFFFQNVTLVLLLNCLVGIYYLDLSSIKLFTLHIIEKKKHIAYTKYSRIYIIMAKYRHKILMWRNNFNGNKYLPTYMFYSFNICSLAWNVSQLGTGGGSVIKIKLANRTSLNCILFVLTVTHFLLKKLRNVENKKKTIKNG